VDAISGGTITSKGLEAMLMDCLSGYVAYFKELAKN
jgi:Na+-transporting NADH:ubiquinone oxidoreductase subunit NqrC